MKLVAKTQKTSDKLWSDESGMQIPSSRTTKLERLMERKSGKLLKDALKVNAQLTTFKDQVQEVCREVYDLFMEEHNNKKDRKGNFTWYNFDRSIKIQSRVNERIEFDDLNIIACKDKLDEFLDANVESKDDFIKQLVLDAFETSRGKLDAKKVMSLLRYKSKIKAPLFQEAMELLENSIRRPDSKTYFQIWAKDKSGEYQNVDLNFSSI
ncbi:MAG: DUF3164 family protein [Flavobacteriales bacterium]|jgi:hypothetical protein|nr:DUF3164 family protein [Flavobacteriales bacterium]